LLQGYGYIALFLLVSLAFAGVMITLPVLLRKLKVIPHKPSAVKSSTVECGLETTAVALDVMLVFLLPWALVLAGLGAFALGAAALFVFILSLGYIYAWRKGVLQWK
jgi:NADH-quinone oxidoreductase subunit A